MRRDWVKQESKIRQLRQKQNLSIKELAQKMKVSHVAVVKWDSGQSFPRTKSLPLLAKILKCSIADFF